MGSSFFGIVIEILVATLLIATIAYCIIVNRKLDRLRANQESLKSIIQDLNQSTLHAENATGELKKTVHKANTDLSLQIDKAERVRQSLRTQYDNSELMLNKLEAISIEKEKNTHNSMRTIKSDQVWDSGFARNEFAGNNIDHQFNNNESFSETTNVGETLHKKDHWERTELGNLTPQEPSQSKEQSVKRSRFEWES